MARTAPVPNFAAIPGMNPGLFVLGGGGGGGGSGAGGGKGGKKGQGAGGNNGGKDANGGGKSGIPGCTKEGEPVDVATGTVLHERFDFALNGLFTLELRATYTSAACERNHARMGWGWAHNFATLLETRRRSIGWLDEEGRMQDFPMLSPGESFSGVLGRTLSRLDESVFELFTEEDALTRRFVVSPTDPQCFLLHSVRDRLGHAISLRYQGDKLVEIVDTVGRVIRVSYTSNDQIERFSVQRGTDGPWITLAQYGYDDEENQVSHTDPAGYRRTYEYEDHLLVKWVDRAGVTVHYRYDGPGRDARCTETWALFEGIKDPALAPDLPTHMDTPSGKRPIKGMFHRVFLYDEDRTEVYNTRGSRKYVHNALGMVEGEVDGRGGVTSSVFDAQGRKLEATDELGRTTRWQYDDRGRLIAETDPEGRTFAFEYDGDSTDIRTIVAPNGGMWTYVRDGRGLVTQIRGPLGNATRYSYDERGLPIRVDEDGKRPLSIVRHPTGRPAEVEDAQGKTIFYYDDWGRFLGLRRRDGAERRWSLNDRGDVLAKTDPLGRVTRYDYDGEGNMVAVYAPDGTVRRAAYGAFERLTSVTDAAGRVTRLLYDWEGEVVCAVAPSGEEYRFEYDADGNLVKEIAPDGRETRHFYDLTGRRTRVIGPAGDATEYTYDGSGNLLTQETDDGEKITFERDDLEFIVSATTNDSQVRFVRDISGNVLKEIFEVDGRSFEVESTFTPSGERESRRVGQRLVEWERDSVGDILARRYDGGRRQSLAWDVMGRLTGFSYGEGLTVELSYDAAGRVEQTKATRPKAGWVIDEGLTHASTRDVVLSRTYEYSAHNEIAVVRDPVFGDIEYEYDLIGQLREKRTQSKTDRFSQDPNGNVAFEGAPFAKGKGDQVTSTGGIDLVYDSAGRVERRTQMAGQGASELTLVWTASDTLSMVRNDRGEVTRYTYDAFGRRLLKKHADGSKVYYVWDGNVLAAEVSVSPSGEEKQTTYLFEQWEASLPVAEHDGERWLDVVTSPVGTVTELIDERGTLAYSAQTSAYGKIEALRAALTDTKQRMPGQWFDPETGLHYNRFRYYDPEAGRYLSPDPIGVEAGLNEYTYARNPIGWSDPLGLADGQKLEASMKKAGMGSCPTGFQTHHVIPEELYNDPDVNGILGSNPHDAKNGMFLPESKADYDREKKKGKEPGKTLHCGRHDRYNKYVKRRLLEIKNNKKLKPCQKAAKVAELQDELKKELQAGTLEFEHTRSSGEKVMVQGLNCRGVVK